MGLKKILFGKRTYRDRIEAEYETYRGTQKAKRGLSRFLFGDKKKT